MSRSSRSTRSLSVLVGVAALVSTAVLGAGSPADAGPGGSGGSGGSGSVDRSPSSVIVFLRDQLSATPATRAHVSARRSFARSDQNRVLTELSGPRPSGVVHFTAANAFAATVTGDQARELADDPAVAQVIPNSSIPRPVGSPTTPAVGVSPAQRRAAVGADGRAGAGRQALPAGVCPAKGAKPLLEPEALGVTNTASDDPSARTAQSLGIDGKGVKVAYIADGIDPANPDFIRADKSRVIIDYKAFSADGPLPAEGGAEAYGDASAIGAQGRVSHDLSTFVNPAYPLPSGCNVRVLGMSPGASIVALKTDFSVSSIIQAIDYASTVAHVDVINESFGLSVVPDTSARNAIQLFNRLAVAAGVSVTVSTGDAGVTSTIDMPATDPAVISVAATTTSRSYVQTGYAGARTFGNGRWVNDQISSLSSGGVSQRGGTVDLAAPGESGWAACDAGSPACLNNREKGSGLQLFGGTSQSAPLTAGAAALVIQAYRSTHGGASPSPALVKRLLVSTTRDLGMPAFEQGAGLLDARAAVEAALTYPGAGSTPAGLASGAASGAASGVASNIVVSKTQANVSGAPGTAKTITLGVRNVGRRKLTVATATRDYYPLRTDTTKTSISARSTQTVPDATTGDPLVFKKVTFSVPTGTDRLASTLNWVAVPRDVGDFTITPAVRLALFAPDGSYVANSRPQGGDAASANFANVDVRRPKAGRWTAVLTTPAGQAGHTGAVTLQNTSQRARPVGSISRPVFSLQPGQRKDVRVRLQIPTRSGDTTQSITVASSDGHQTSVPVVLRSVVPITRGSGSFGGVITGGNARLANPAQTFTYAFDVPRSTRDVSAGITLASDPGLQLQGVLVDPHGQAQAVGTNVRTNAKDQQIGQGRTLQLTTAAVVPGRWRLVLIVANPVTGKETREPFTGEVALNRVRVSAPGLPTTASTTLRRGSPTRVGVAVTNTGRAPLTVQIDPRSTDRHQLELTAQNGSQTLTLPNQTLASFLVPPQTSQLTATSAADLPTTVTLSSGLRGISVLGGLRTGQQGSHDSMVGVTEDDGSIGTGIWNVLVQQVGPVGTAGGAHGHAQVDLIARTPAFDPAVTSRTGDYWKISTDPEAATGTPVIIQPGASATVQVLITPSASAGSVVTGTLNVISPPSNAASTPTSGELIASLPYRYTIGSESSPSPSPSPAPAR